MKLITFITLIIVNCIIALASPAWEHIVIDMSDGLTNGFRDDASYPEDFSIAPELHVEPCIKTIEGSANSVLDELYENGCALISFSAGDITREYKFNCCGASSWLRINTEDFYNIRKTGKLDGLRYQQTYGMANSRQIVFRKVVGTASTTITTEEFLP